MKKYISNLEDKVSSVLNESLVTDAAELVGIEEEDAEDRIKGLSFANYIELGNAIDLEDAETAREILSTVAPIETEVEETSGAGGVGAGAVAGGAVGDGGGTGGVMATDGYGGIGTWDGKKRKKEKPGLKKAGKGIYEADNPFASAPSQGSSVDALAQQTDQAEATPTTADNEEPNQLQRKEIDDLMVGDDIEVIDIDGDPAAVTVKNPRAPGDTLIVQTDKGEEHIVKKQAVSGTPTIQEMYEAAMATEDSETFKREVQNPQWRERLAAEREKRIAHLAKRGNRPEDHHMRRVMTPKGKGTIYSINNHEPSEFHAPVLTASVRLDSDPGGYGGGAQQIIFRLDDLEFIDDDYNILDEMKSGDFEAAIKDTPEYVAVFQVTNVPAWAEGSVNAGDLVYWNDLSGTLVRVEGGGIALTASAVSFVGHFKFRDVLDGKVGNEEPLEEVAPPGMEDWIKKRKPEFKERYGKDWESVLYATAWKRHNNESLEEGEVVPFPTVVPYEEAWRIMTVDEYKAQRHNFPPHDVDFNQEPGAAYVRIKGEYESIEEERDYARRISDDHFIEEELSEYGWIIYVGWGRDDLDVLQYKNLDRETNKTYRFLTVNKETGDWSIANSKYTNAPEVASGSVDELIPAIRKIAGVDLEEGQNAGKTEHSGAKKGKGAYYGRKKDAKRDSNKKRRANDKKAMNESMKGEAGRNDPWREQSPKDKSKLASGPRSWAEILDALSDEELIDLYKERHPDWKYGEPNSMQSGWPIKREIDRRKLIVEGLDTHVHVEHRDPEGRFIVVYAPPAGYWVVGKGSPYSENIDRMTFDTLDDAMEHAELSCMDLEESVDLNEIRRLAGLNETSTAGATGAGNIAAGPVALGDMVKRSIYGKPEPKKRKKESSDDGLGRSKKK